MSRNYRDEYDNYQAKPEQVKRRSSRNSARRKAIKLGNIGSNDARDIDHVNGNPLDNRAKNLKARSKRQNRSFKRNPDATKL